MTAYKLDKRTSRLSHDFTSLDTLDEQGKYDKWEMEQELKKIERELKIKKNL